MGRLLDGRETGRCPLARFVSNLASQRSAHLVWVLAKTKIVASRKTYSISKMFCDPVILSWQSIAFVGPLRGIPATPLRSQLRSNTANTSSNGFLRKDL